MVKGFDHAPILYEADACSAFRGKSFVTMAQAADCGKGGVMKGRQ